MDSSANNFSATINEKDDFVRGTVSRVTYSNEETGFTVLRVEPDSDLKRLGPIATVVGSSPSKLTSGTTIVARGSWRDHPRFGRQFRAYSITETIPTGKDAIARYLASGAIRGLGPVLAERIVEKFGDETLRIFDDEPEKLEQVSGLGKKKLLEILSAWEEKSNLREVFLFFQGHNISLKLAQRIHNHYGSRSIEVVKQDPYILSRELWGIGFQTADKIALSLGVSRNSVQRCTAGLVHILREGSNEGHCFLPLDVLKSRALTLLEIDNSNQELEQSLEGSVASGELLNDKDRIYAPYLFSAEEQLAQNIAGRTGKCSAPKREITADTVDWFCSRPSFIHDDSQKVKSLVLSSEQQEALRRCAESSLAVITGGPGCGKTTVVRAITQMFQKAHLSIKLAAPTGRAAQRLSQVCQMEASTIHRLLKFDPISRSFQHSQNDLLPLDALIVDEASMIDISLAASLFKAVPPGARIVVVGDADQLPSVGPGLFLANLLEIKEIPTVRLNTLFRRAEESSITLVAHEINRSCVPHIPEPDGHTKSDTYFIPTRDLKAAAEMVERLVVEQIPKRFGFSLQDITVLSPVNQGELGVIALNKRLQNRIIPNPEHSTSVKSGDLSFYLGDRVCQRVNNYNIHKNGVFNGDQGTVIGIDTEAKQLIVRLWDGREIAYTPDSISQLDLAYALTIHRSQGSEIPAVVLVLHDSHHIMLERQLLYTAITRAKQLLIVVGTRRALKTATRRARSRKRYSALVERVTINLTESLF